MNESSLRLQLLRWLLLPLIGLLAVNAWFSNRAAVATANQAFDRLLVASAEAIAENVSADGTGTITVDLPYSALQLLESNIQERVFYRVIGPSGRTITGYDDLPAPSRPHASASDGTRFYAARYRDDDIHLVALDKRVYGAAGNAPVVIVVAETGEDRDALSRQILLEGLERESGLVIAAAALVWLGLGRGLRPLQRLRQQIARRSPSDLSPIDTEGVQRELRPLIEALNHHTRRIDGLLARRQRFLADASHQMRTPLAEMRAQIEMRLRDVGAVGTASAAAETLADVKNGIDHLARLVQQMLLLARAEDAALGEQRSTVVNLGEIAQAAAADCVPAARRKAMDLGFEDSEKPVLVSGHALLLRELAVNIIGNAILYGRQGGQVTVRVRPGAKVALEVEDDGPGIPPDDRDKVFARFYRQPGQAVQGSGLGLSIARDIALAHQGWIELSTPSSGRGLCVRVRLPALPAEADQDD